MADLARAGEARTRVMGAQDYRVAAGRQSLTSRLQARIRSHGPLSVADYMQACLSDPNEGVYAARQPIGKTGDFITAPEISQIFGELLGLWCVAVWQSMGEPTTVTVAELGPGRGTLMADALRAWRLVPTFLNSVSIALVETGPVLRDTQRKTLHASPAPLRWYRDVHALPEEPLILLANEFIDALPIRQHIRRGSAWRERVVILDTKGEFTFGEGDTVHDAALPPAPDGAILETRPAVMELLASLAVRAGQAPIAVLILDYGHDESGFGDTLQAVIGHRFAEPLAAPGEADLSAHVDFAALEREAAALGLHPCGPMPQGEFLLKLGLATRRDRLLDHARPEQRSAIASGAMRLIDPHQMGVLFNVLALMGRGLPAPPPFHSDI
ncbi:MAG: class I SAM-dependent methyltransferase [Methyloceanibacter sp.]